MNVWDMPQNDNLGLIEAMGIDVGAMLSFLVIAVLFLGFFLPIYMRSRALSMLNSSSNYNERVRAAELLALSDPGETKQVNLGQGEILEITYYLSANDFLRVKKTTQVTE